MSDGSGTSDPLFELEAERHQLFKRIERLEEAIGELEGAATLRADAAARLASYRHSHQRRLFELKRLEWEIGRHSASAETRSVAAVSHRPSPTVAEEMLKHAQTRKKKRRWLQS